MYFLTARGGRGVLTISVASRIHGHAAGPPLQISTATATAAALRLPLPRLPFSTRGWIPVLPERWKQHRPYSQRRAASLPLRRETRAGPHLSISRLLPLSGKMKQVLLCLLGKDGWAKEKRGSDTRPFPSTFSSVGWGRLKGRAYLAWIRHPSEMGSTTVQTH